jgi:hypothetical protein
MTAFDDISRLTGIAWPRRASWRLRTTVCTLVFAAAIGLSSPAPAQPVTGELQVETANGFGRILLHLNEEVESDVRIAGNIIIVSFKRPVDIGIEKLQAIVPDYVGSARRDPDGRGFRIALNRKVTVNSMAAGERLYIDLLPDSWKGLAPGLPKEVIAERTLRTQRLLASKGDKPARVRVATQPTFTRYVFELPEIIPVTSDRGADNLTLVFAARMKFDFGEVKATLPDTVKSIESFEQNERVTVRFALDGKADVRLFREDKNFVVDIGSADAREAVAQTTLRPDDLARIRRSRAAECAGGCAGAADDPGCIRQTGRIASRTSAKRTAACRRCAGRKSCFSCAGARTGHAGEVRFA